MVRRVVATIGVGLLFAGPSSVALAAPGDTTSGMTMSLEANNGAGYSLTVQSASETVVAEAGGQQTRCADGADIIGSDYAADITLMNADAYSGILDYVASTL